jgi:cytochrome c556
LKVLLYQTKFLEMTMKIRTAVTLLCMAAALTTVAIADDEQDYQAWMKTVGGTAGKLRKELDAKAFADAAKDAATLQDVFKHVEGYWAKSNTADAVKAAQDAQSAARGLVAAAGSENAEQSAASLKMLMSTCGGCHNAHREKVEGGFKIKP